MSLQAIATQVNRHPTTVAFWLRKFGLEAVHHERFAPKGGLSRTALEDLLREGLTLQQIAERLDRSVSTICYWMRRHDLKTERAKRWNVPEGERPVRIHRECVRHGATTFQRTGSKGYYRCLKCRSARVAARRRAVKLILVREAGGKCRLCGYDKWFGALQFHHLDPKLKEFNIALRGVARSLERARSEASKCVLLCANCHAEVEGGVAAVAVECSRG
jgi:transposase